MPFFDFQLAGYWNASTNDRGLKSGKGQKGQLYLVTVAGNTVLDGITSWYVGDSAWFDDFVWRVIPGPNRPGIPGNITATGSVTPRSQPDRFGERSNVFDFGAVGNGATNDAPAIQATAVSAASRKTPVVLPSGNFAEAAGVTVSGWLYGIAGDRWAAPGLSGVGPRQTTLINTSTDYAITYTLANSAHVYDNIRISGIKFRGSTGGGIDFAVGIGQSVLDSLEFDGMPVNRQALHCDNANGMFTANILNCRFWTEEFQFNGNILSLGGAVNVNIHFHDNFITHMKANAANAVVNNSIITVADSNQFEHTGGVTANFNHTFWSFTGFNFGASFVNNYLEGTWGCLVRASATSGALIGAEIRNLYAYEYDETITGGGTPSPFIADFRNLTKNARVEGVTVINGCVAVGGGYLFDDPWHAMDGEGVHRFWNASSGNQANRLVSQLLTGKNQSGTVVSVYNQNESWRRTGRGMFPTNPNQGVGSFTNFTIFLPTDVGVTRGVWATATVYTTRDTVLNGPSVYECRGPVAGGTSGTSGATAPSGADPNNDVSDGVLLWRYLRADADLNKVQPGGYLLALTVRTADLASARSALYYVIFDDYGTDYTTCMQIGTDQTKGASAPSSLIVSVTNRGIFSVSAMQAAAVAHQCSFAWTKMQAL
jgi:hypothetical protein